MPPAAGATARVAAPLARRRPWRRRALAVGIGVLLAPLVLELGVRLWPGTLPPGVRAAVSLHDLRFISQPDQQLGYAMLPGFDRHPLATSDLQVFHVTTRPAPWSAEPGIGFRDDFAPAPPFAVLVGDSFAMGWGVEEGDCFAAVCERALGRAVHDLGVCGYGPQQALGTLERFGLGCRPRVVVWAFYGNDLEDAVEFERWAKDRSAPWPATAPKSAFDRALNRYSAAYKLFRFVGKHFSVDRRRFSDGARAYLFSPFWMKTLDLRRPRAEAGCALVCALVDRFAALAGEHGFAPVLIAAPYREQVYREEYASVDPAASEGVVLEAGYARVVEHARALGIQVVDTLPLLRAHKGEDLYLYEDPHWSPAGNRIVGEALAAALRSVAGG